MIQKQNLWKLELIGKLIKFSLKVIKYNSYKINNKNSLLFIIVSTIVILLIISTINIKKIILKEIDGFQSRFVTFSSYTQLFDSGDIQDLEKIQFKDYFPGARQILSVLYDGIISDKELDDAIGILTKARKQKLALKNKNLI